MADRMEFPKTMKEFIDSYSFKDKEEVYTNGAELIPVFRVEQAMEHYFEQKCKDCAGCTAWNADCANIRAKAIDEFAEKLCVLCGEASMIVVFENRVKADVLTLDGLMEIVMETAEQLKGGAE